MYTQKELKTSWFYFIKPLKKEFLVELPDNVSNARSSKTNVFTYS